MSVFDFFSNDIISIILAIGSVLIVLLLIGVSFLYLRANANFEYKLKLSGNIDDLAAVNRELKQKQQELEDTKALLSARQAELDGVNANAETIALVKGDLQKLSMEYSNTQKMLQDAQNELSKSQYLKQLVEEQQETLSTELDDKIREQEETLAQLQAQTLEQKTSQAIADSLNGVFESFADNSQLEQHKTQLQEEIELRQMEINELDDKIRAQEEKIAELQSQALEHKTTQTLADSLSDVFENFADNSHLEQQKNQLQEEIAARQKEIDELDARIKEQERELYDGAVSKALSEAVASLSQQASSSSKLEELEAAIAQKEAELAKLQNSISQESQSNQLSDALNKTFADLKDALSLSMMQLQEELAAQTDLSAQKASLEQKLQELKDEIAEQEERAAAAADAAASAASSAGAGSAAAPAAAGEDAEAYLELETAPKIEQFVRNFVSCKQSNNTPLSELDALERFQRYLSSQGFFYSPRTIKAFHTSLKVQQINPISVLAGLSGTGKTQLALQYSNFFNFYCEHVAVQPRWDSKDDLLGFYNFLEKRYQPTELVKALYYFNQQRQQQQPFSPMLMVILDEMNLARVEYYFSEFLSKLELRGGNREKPNPKSIISIDNGPHDFFVGSNVVIVGTMNDDESTYSLSDKVLDRANVLHFGKPHEFQEVRRQESVSPIYISAQNFNQWCTQSQSQYRLSDELTQSINKLNEKLNQIGKAFGYRVNNSIKQYISMYPGLAAGSNTRSLEQLAFADQIEMKIIPKLSGLEQSEKAEDCLGFISQLISATEDRELIAAFNVAKNNYDNNGMFIWQGVSRSVDQY